MAKVHFRSLRNCDLYTTCCNVVIHDDQDKCPECGEEVPATPEERWKSALIQLHGTSNLKAIREHNGTAELKWTERGTDPKYTWRFTPDNCFDCCRPFRERSDDLSFYTVVIDWRMARCCPECFPKYQDKWMG